MCRHLAMARRTPSISTLSSALRRRPAVSLNTIGYPAMFSALSTTSRVVPAMGDTIAAGRLPSTAFNNNNIITFTNS